eukprot:TRINITY_DN3990_c0_g1_i1.p1 TRINITY_DN3990_c0_g1~~TRINITY_DN3990_c0_g1_i1.p1  ORF type:complete len:117 (+),score=18.21 TRINITY_DN3990_c0_g1_i1:220-570(+)
MRPQVLIAALLVLSACSGVYSARGLWRIYSTSDCGESDKEQSLIGAVIMSETMLLERSCSSIPTGSNQFASFTTNLAGFNLQSFTKEGSGWNIHMAFNASTCGVFYDILFIGNGDS